MLFRILGAWFATIAYKIVWHSLKLWWPRWYLRSFVLVSRNLLHFVLLHPDILINHHLINWSVIDEIVQVELLLLLITRSSGGVLSLSVILKAVLRHVREVLEVLTWLWAIRHWLLLACFYRVKALSSNILFPLWSHGTVYMINSLKFHLSVCPAFVSSFRASLHLVVTSINWA